VGCTFIHAGYILTWLAAFFGPAKAVTAYASCLLPDKGIPVDKMAPDFSVGCIEYDEDIVARVTCGLVAPRDKSLTIVGDDGIIYVNTIRNDIEPVYIQMIPSRGRLSSVERRIGQLHRWLRSHTPVTFNAGDEWRLKRKYPWARKRSSVRLDRSKPVDFNRGPAEMVEAIRQKRPCRLSAKLGLHILEIVEALQYPERFGYRRTICSEFEAVQPLSWET
jgi:predicted dehydrogenase